MSVRAFGRTAAVAAVAAMASVAEAWSCPTETFTPAVRAFDVELLNRCLKADKTLVDTPDEAGCPPIVAAAINKNFDAVKYFASKGGDVNGQCDSGSTAMSRFSSDGNLEGVKFLHDAGVDIYKIVGDKPWTALSYAAEHGHMDILRYLHNFDADFGVGWTGTALMWAAGTGDATMLEMMINRAVKRGDSLDERDKHGFTAAVWAAQRGELEALIALGDAGADLSIISHGGLTALMSAAYYGKASTLKYLLQQGAAIEAKDQAGWTAVMWAAAGESLEAAGATEFLFNEGACMKPKHAEWTPTMVASAVGNLETVEWLLGHGAPFSNTNGYGKTAEQIATENGHPEVAALLHRIGGINAYHADSEKKNRAAATETAKELRAKAKENAKKEARKTSSKLSEELVQKHIKILKDQRAEQDKENQLKEMMQGPGRKKSTNKLTKKSAPVKAKPPSRAGGGDSSGGAYTAGANAVGSDSRREEL